MVNAVSWQPQDPWHEEDIKKWWWRWSECSFAVAADEVPPCVGFIGLGIMGSPNGSKYHKSWIICLRLSDFEIEQIIEIHCLRIPSNSFLRDVGDGAAMQLIANVIMGIMMASFSEGLLLCEKVEVDLSVLVEVVSPGTISAPMFSMKGPSTVQSLYPTAFLLKHQQKDLRLALGLAESVSQPAQIAAPTNKLHKVGKSCGLSDKDFSAVTEALKVTLQNQSKE
ncbi:glyoxylate/succinic semialdehyde reductase 2, chloroplastic-like [Rhododendron vialii]|uniref:glyoxylate/succinic semialdehyde reductase 2, chloroplastic-like n=1 Tax=Rhododendron vialii TaxID=182163 RepID=UPI00265DC653|nr:glyoxylate/succinic semialdehyde reductase 2, chloroplastic-like [Rhododendron vialii]